MLSTEQMLVGKTGVPTYTREGTEKVVKVSMQKESQDEGRGGREALQSTSFEKN